MDMQQKCLRCGALAVGCAIVLRLIAGIGLTPDNPRLLSALVFLTTGRLVRLAEPSDTKPLSEAAPLSVPSHAQSDRKPVQFTPQEAAAVTIQNTSGYVPDIAALLTQPLQWDLTADVPTVLILHTHGSESYTKTESYEETGLYRTLDERYNMISVGQYVSDLLQQAGIRVIHDKTLHDQPSYNGSYQSARTAISAHLGQNPAICLILDLHRDAALDASGSQIGYTVSTPYGAAAKLMLVMGTDAGGYPHAAWQDNLSLAAKLQVTLERTYPGICRPMQLRTSRFNQDLSPGALLVEVGAAGNTRQEALLSARILADAIIELAHGCN